MSHLLDSSVLIALTFTDHEHHDRASVWAAGRDDLATCAVVEGALVRFVLRVGESSATAQAMVRGLRTVRGLTFLAEELSYADIDMRHVVGHRQATDAYLAALAGAGGRLLATFDVALASALPDRCVLVPDLLEP